MTHLTKPILPNNVFTIPTERTITEAFTRQLARTFDSKLKEHGFFHRAGKHERNRAINALVQDVIDLCMDFEPTKPRAARARAEQITPYSRMQLSALDIHTIRNLYAQEKGVNCPLTDTQLNTLWVSITPEMPNQFATIELFQLIEEKLLKETTS